jgi:hypothetical protein
MLRLWCRSRLLVHHRVERSEMKLSVTLRRLPYATSLSEASPDIGFSAAARNTARMASALSATPPAIFLSKAVGEIVRCLDVLQDDEFRLAQLVHVGPTRVRDLAAGCDFSGGIRLGEETLSRPCRAAAGSKTVPTCARIGDANLEAANLSGANLGSRVLYRAARESRCGQYPSGKSEPIKSKRRFFDLDKYAFMYSHFSHSTSL